jgi:tetratricopeptide (TPR) repeat protein
MAEKDDKEELGNADFEISFYEGLVAKHPDFLQALMALGDLYTKKGFYAKGLEIDKKLAKMRPEDPYVLYNLACSYSLVNDLDHAFQVVRLAVESGYDDFKHLERDHDLDNLKRDERFTNYLSQVKVRGEYHPNE